MATRFPLQRARAFVDRLDVDIRDVEICFACLSFVAIPLGDGDEHEALLWARRMTPDLWYEGLEGYALSIVADADARGVAGADAARRELESKRGRSAVARALVLALAADLHQQITTATRVEAAARPRLALAPPELN
jgi:hypothetical protein